jgi:hypothetical protein
VTAFEIAAASNLPKSTNNAAQQATAAQIADRGVALLQPQEASLQMFTRYARSFC